MKGQAKPRSTLSEITALRWDDVDFDKNSFSFSAVSWTALTGMRRCLGWRSTENESSESYLAQACTTSYTGGLCKIGFVG
jgi:hypothetical protein